MRVRDHIALSAAAAAALRPWAGRQRTRPGGRGRAHRRQPLRLVLPALPPPGPCGGRPLLQRGRPTAARGHQGPALTGRGAGRPRRRPAQAVAAAGCSRDEPARRPRRAPREADAPGQGGRTGAGRLPLPGLRIAVAASPRPPPAPAMAAAVLPDAAPDLAVPRLPRGGAPAREGITACTGLLQRLAPAPPESGSRPSAPSRA